MTLAASSRAAFVDTNVPMYAAGTDHPLKGPCVEVMAMIAAHPRAFVTNAEVLQELIHCYLSERRWAFGREVVKEFAGLLEGRIEPVYAEDILEAARLADDYPGVSSRDLVHTATAWRIGVSRIVSTDAHFDILPGVERLAPERVGEWGGPLVAEPRRPLA